MHNGRILSDELPNFLHEEKGMAAELNENIFFARTEGRQGHCRPVREE